MQENRKMAEFSRVFGTAALSIVLLNSVPIQAGSIYFADIFNPDLDTGSIRRVNDDGTGVEKLIDTGGGLRGIDVDPIAKKIYWTDVNNTVIRRADLDGENQEDLVIGVPWAAEVALYPAADLMFWGDQIAGTIEDAALDGSNPDLVKSTAFHHGLALDLVNNKMYWSTSISDIDGDILRSDLDGLNVETVVTDEFKPGRLALDVAGGKVYWTDYVLDVVRRANFDGSEMQDLYIVGSNRNPRGITLDLIGGKVYWGQDLEIYGYTGEIMRMNLDGTDAEVVLSDLGLVNDVAFVPSLLITQQPQSLTLYAGQPAVFTVEAVDIGPIDYQWRKDGLAMADDDRISGSDTDTLTIDPTVIDDHGSYDVVVTGEAGSITSDPATLTVYCEGDANRDNLVDPLDSGFVLSRFGCIYPGDGELCLQADTNGDGVVDPLDVGFVLSRFDTCP